MRAYNIMEDIVKKYLDEMLAIRFDICTCDKCRQDIAAYVLTRIPPKYVTTETGAMHTLIDQIKVEQASVILKELVEAINFVSTHPKHIIPDDKKNAYNLLMQQIKLDRGVDFSHYREQVLKRRIAVRMRARKVTSYSDYLQILGQKMKFLMILDIE